MTDKMETSAAQFALHWHRDTTHWGQPSLAGPAYSCVSVPPLLSLLPVNFFQICLCWEALPSHQTRGAEGGFPSAQKAPLDLVAH